MYSPIKNDKNTQQRIFIKKEIKVIYGTRKIKH